MWNIRLNRLLKKKPLDTQKCMGVLWVFIKVRFWSFSKRFSTAVPLLLSAYEPHVWLCALKSPQTIIRGDGRLLNKNCGSRVGTLIW